MLLPLRRVDTNICQEDVALEGGKRERNQSGGRTDVIESIQEAAFQDLAS
jgi:hypothetical protein